VQFQLDVRLPLGPQLISVMLRVVTLICLFLPLGNAIYDSDTIKLDARPITNLIHRTVDWALIFLLVALAVRPLSRILRFNRLLDVRRMIGAGAFAYAAAHFTLYTFDLNFDWRSWRVTWQATSHDENS
jgi:methionine sulfoxide reductase heme-binding subunit